MNTSSSEAAAATSGSTSGSAAGPTIHTLPTPNPDALMFRVEEALVPAGTFEYQDRAEAERLSPLAARLLAEPGVALVLIAPRFVTVRKASDARWIELAPIIKDALADFLLSGDMAVLDEAVVVAAGATSAVEQRILQLLEEEVRPALAQDGGDVTYEGFENGVVKLRMIGACGTCPSSVATLKNGIEALLREEIPEVVAVEQV